MKLLLILVLGIMLRAAPVLPANITQGGCLRSLPVARRLAEESIRTDSSHPESPLALARAEGLSDLELLSLMNEPRSRLEVLPADRQVEGGETDLNYFRFVLRIPALSDHLFFVMVEKSCEGAVYNYGFN